MTDTTNAAAVALLILNEKLSDWRNGPEPVWNSTWPVYLVQLNINAALSADLGELQALYEDISATSLLLAKLLWRRSNILNKSGSFSIDIMVRLTGYIDETGGGKGLYRAFIQPKLDELNDFDLKY